MEVALVVVAGLLLIVILRWSGGAYWRRRIRRWAAEEDLELVDFRGAKFYEGPRRFLRSDGQFAFHVTVRDRRGVARRCWLAFGSTWSIWPTAPPEVVWEDTAA